MTMTLVQTVTVGSGGASSIEFTSIPQTGTDLLVVVSARGARSAVDGDMAIRFNGDTGTYLTRFLKGSGSAASSGNYSLNRIVIDSGVVNATATANTFGNLAIYIPNYTSSANKSVSVDSVGENNATAAYQNITAGQWSNTSAITSITLTEGASANWVEYSTASLYKIEKGSGGATVS